MSDQQLPPWWKRFWSVIGDVGRLRTLWWIAAASGSATWVVSALPGGWHQPQYWLVAIFTFSSTLATLGAATWGFGLVGRSIDRWRHPATLELVACGGDTVYLELRHTGVATRYTAEARIVELLGESANPSPTLYLCELRMKDGRSASEVLLSNGDWAHIPIATIDTNNFDKAWLAIVRGGRAANVSLDGHGPGAVVEVSIKSEKRVETHRVAAVYGGRNGPQFIGILDPPPDAVAAKTLIRHLTGR